MLKGYWQKSGLVDVSGLQRTRPRKIYQPAPSLYTLWPHHPAPKKHPPVFPAWGCMKFIRIRDTDRRIMIDAHPSWSMRVLTGIKYPKPRPRLLRSRIDAIASDGKKTG